MVFDEFYGIPDASFQSLMPIATTGTGAIWMVSTINMNANLKRTTIIARRIKRAKPGEFLIYRWSAICESCRGARVAPEMCIHQIGTQPWWKMDLLADSPIARLFDDNQGAYNAEMLNIDYDEIGEDVFSDTMRAFVHAPPVAVSRQIGTVIVTIDPGENRSASVAMAFVATDAHAVLVAVSECNEPRRLGQVMRGFFFELRMVFTAATFAILMERNSSMSYAMDIIVDHMQRAPALDHYVFLKTGAGLVGLKTDDRNKHWMVQTTRTWLRHGALRVGADMLALRDGEVACGDEMLRELDTQLARFAVVDDEHVPPLYSGKLNGMRDDMAMAVNLLPVGMAACLPEVRVHQVYNNTFSSPYIAAAVPPHFGVFAEMTRNPLPPSLVLPRLVDLARAFVPPLIDGDVDEASGFRSGFL